jgi:hypothetical protein
MNRTGILMSILFLSALVFSTEKTTSRHASRVDYRKKKPPFLLIVNASDAW